MDNVIHLFGDKPPPAAEESDWVDGFIENTLSHSLYLLQQVHDASNEAEFREAARKFQRDVAAWQV